MAESAIATREGLTGNDAASLFTAASSSRITAGLMLMLMLHFLLLLLHIKTCRLDKHGAFILKDNRFVMEVRAEMSVQNKTTAI